MTAGPAYTNLRVLVIDDNPYMRTFLRALLHALGITLVREAENGSVGLELLRAYIADLVLTYLAMKPMDGLQFTRHIRRDSDSPALQTPIIMITGFTEMSSVVAARDMGVNQVLAKPVTMQRLALRVAEVIDRPRAFVRCDGYVGPDRRRRKDNAYTGPWRRSGDDKNLSKFS